MDFRFEKLNACTNVLQFIMKIALWNTLKMHDMHYQNTICIDENDVCEVERNIVYK